jgi:hypothetical protein
VPAIRTIIPVIGLATLLVACGSPASVAPSAAASVATQAPTSSPSPSEPQAAADLIAAVEATLEQGTVRLEQTIEFQDSAVIPDGTTASAQGQASLGPPQQLRLRADFSALGVGKMVMIRDDTLLYMRGSAFEPLSGEDRWLLVDIESEHPAAIQFRSLASGQNDMSMALYYLYGATGDVEATAGEQIAGQPTTRYEMELDLEAAREVIPASQADALEDVIASLRVGGIERQLDGVAWVGEDGFIHRVQYTYRLGSAAGGGNMLTVIDFAEFGAPLDLQIPRDRDVVWIEDVAS